MLNQRLVEDIDQLEDIKPKQQKRIQSQTAQLILQYIISDIARKPRSFKIGLFTIYLVITFLALLESCVQLTPLIFLQLSETQSGDSDLIFVPQSASNRSQNYESQSSFLNTTEIEEYFNKMPSMFGFSPRWLLVGNLINNNTQVVKINDKLRTFVLILDQDREISIGIGRRSQQQPISGNQVLISATTLRGLNASIGDTLQVNVDLEQLVSTFSDSNQDLSLVIQQVINLTINDPLRPIFGDDFDQVEYESTDLQQQADDLVIYADLLESNEEFKEQAKIVAEEYVYNLNITDEQKHILIRIIDTEFSRNMSEDARTLQRASYKLNSTVTITDIEYSLSTILSETANFTFDVVVAESIEASRGKWQDGLCALLLDKGNASQILIEGILERFEEVVTNSRLHDNTTVGAIAELIPVEYTKEYFWNQTKDLNISEYALSQQIVLNDRINRYNDKESIKKSVIDVTNSFFKLAGINYPTYATSTLATSVSGYLMLKNFIDNLIAAATIILLMLSILLIYSLMIGDVEEKTYEFGMLRALGFQKSWLIILLLIQGLTFAIPGLLLGLITCYLLNTLVSMIIFDTTDLVSTYMLAEQAIYLALCLGLIIPIISNIFPIQRALSKTLRDSLDLYHRTINEVMVTVVRLEKMGISLTQTFCALLLISMGFVSYYLIPMAFIFNNITLALSVINVIFIIMIIGFMLLVNLLEGVIERGILQVILLICKFDRNLKQIIFKNMEGHASRNWKTTFMYSLALSFILFAGASLTLDTKVIGDALQSTLGGDITVLVSQADKIGLDEYSIRQHLELEKQREPGLIQDYTFGALLMTHFPFLDRRQWISTLSTFPWSSMRLGGVEPNYLQSVMQEYYIPGEYDEQINYPKLENGYRDAIYGLYNRTGNIDIQDEEDVQKILSQMTIRDSYYKDLDIIKPNYRQDLDREINVIIPEGYKYEVSINVNTPSILYWSGWYRIKVRHMATKVPGFQFSSYRAIATYGQGMISMEDQQYMLNKYLRADIMNISSIQWPDVQSYFSSLPKNLTYGLPKTSLRVKFGKVTSTQERVDFCNRLRNYFKNEQTLLFDVHTLKQEAENAFFYIQILNIVVAIIALTLSFFLILISFVGNVKDNSWEFGVLRAIGLSKQQLTRIYIYEAISLITASGLLGTFIGVTLAVVLTLQILMFIELPFVLLFPTTTFLITCFGGLGTAIIASYIAVLEIRDKSISVILKGLL